MKKNTSTIILFGIFVFSFVLMANKNFNSDTYQSVNEKQINQQERSNGSPGNYTGSPSDGSTCTNCHSAGANFSLTPTITTNIPMTGYVLGQAYTIDVSTTSSGASGWGFELTAENSGEFKVGTYDMTGATGSPKIITSGGSVTHSNDIFSSWNFNWTAPVVDEGVITFYAAVLAANGSGTGGDQTVTTSNSVNLSTLSINEENILAFNIFPNPSQDFVTIQLPNGIMDGSIEVFDLLGKFVKRKQINKVDNKLNLSYLNQGVYLIRLTSEGKTGVTKFIKK